MRFRLNTNVLLALLVGALAGCSSGGGAVDRGPAVVVVGPTLWSEAEVLDVSKYPDVPIEQDDEIVHDVPASLMDNTADDGTLQEISGFRVQIFASIERSETVEVEERVRLWLRSLDEESRASLGLQEKTEIYHLYSQPYFRVRIGDFKNRVEAILLVQELRRLFPGAFVVPDIIRVMR